ncbi:MAG: GNAT family N-acetyltransferase [Magnetococcales bacterium]|nr:GNAT family N-acetyltransferase [Magnetococcales bacterium]
MKVKTIIADYQDQQQARHIQLLLDEYASGPMGGGTPLDPVVRETVVTKLARIPHAFSILAYVNDKAIGLANCFDSFSTFAARPIINIHDFMVTESHRGEGVSQKMLKKIEAIAKKKGCCKVTLELLSNNEAAKAAYKKFGFSGYELRPEQGQALFWQKILT